MFLFKYLNKFLGVFAAFIISIPWMILATIASCFIFIDAIIRLSPSKIAKSIVTQPFVTLGTFLVAMLVPIEQGWKLGLTRLILSAPARLFHFFKKVIPFGSRKGESVSDIFKSPMVPRGLDPITGTGRFGRITLKLLSLLVPMEVYLSYDARDKSPHNDVNIYYTESIVKTLHEKYKHRLHKKKILTDIHQYLRQREAAALTALAVARTLPSSDDTRAGKIQTAKDNLDMIKASRRCIQYFNRHPLQAIDIHPSLPRDASTVLAYVWQAIESESKDAESQRGLQDKLITTLYQIQRGFNIAQGNTSSFDNPECPTGAIGLLARVLSDEGNRMPGSTYAALDPSPANLTEALKVRLDRQFNHVSTTATMFRHFLQKDPDTYNKKLAEYKANQAKEIKASWKREYSPLLTSSSGRPAVLAESTLNEIIDAGIEAWEPPGMVV